MHICTPTHPCFVHVFQSNCMHSIREAFETLDIEKTIEKNVCLNLIACKYLVIILRSQSLNIFVVFCIQFYKTLLIVCSLILYNEIILIHL